MERDHDRTSPLTLQPCCLQIRGDVEQGLARPQQEQEERELLQIGGVSRSNKRDTGDEGGSRYYDAAVEPVKQAAHQPDGHDATQGEGKQGDTQFPFVDSGLTFDGGNT